MKKNRKLTYHRSEELSRLWKGVIGYFKDQEVNRGRKESRQIYVYEASMDLKEYWTGLTRIIKSVNTRSYNTRTIRDKKYRKRKRHQEGSLIRSQIRYYLCSQNISARKAMKVIRGHWKIENNLHWVKDVVMDEDKSRIKNKNSSCILSIFRSMVLNLISLNGSRDITAFMSKASNNIEFMRTLIE